MELLLKEIIDTTAVFNTNAAKTDNKAAAQRARVASIKLEKLLKEYRKLSLHPLV